ncbi:MAG: SDR family oxidoreductase [Bacteroidota bacterium]
MAERVAIITAASKGMGLACAKSLHAVGYKVALLARSASVHELAQNLGGIGIQGSVTNRADLERLVEATMAKYGRIDAVVNNTGHPPKGALLEISDDEWHVGLDITLLNVTRMAQLVTPHMEKQGHGAFVNISTFAAFEPSLKFPVSSALRAALGSYTKLYAEEYGAKGIRMNNVLPGYIETYPVDDTTREAIPLRRSGKVEEIANTVNFLLSDEASYITGQNIKADGGLGRSV